MKKYLAAAILFALATPAFAQTAAPAPTAPAPAAQAIPQDERTKIELVVRDLLDREPQLIMMAAQKFQMKQQEEQMAKANQAIKDSSKELHNDANSPVSGNPKGDVTVVEFFDYNCGYCKRAHPTTTQLKADDKNVRYVYKQFPILGPTSLTAAQAAIAANMQGKYAAMHDALMENKEPVSDALLEKIAAAKGLDVTKFKADMKSDTVNKIIQADLELGRKLGVNGTPGFVIGDKLFPGAMDLEQFKKAVADARAAQPAKK